MKHSGVLVKWLAIVWHSNNLVARKNLIRKKNDWGQGQYICGPDMEGQGQVHKNSPGPGPDRTSDSLVLLASQRIFYLFLLSPKRVCDTVMKTNLHSEGVKYTPNFRKKTGKSKYNTTTRL